MRDVENAVARARGELVHSLVLRLHSLGDTYVDREIMQFDHATSPVALFSRKTLAYVARKVGALERELDADLAPATVGGGLYGAMAWLLSLLEAEWAEGTNG